MQRGQARLGARFRVPRARLDVSKTALGIVLHRLGRVGDPSQPLVTLIYSNTVSGESQELPGADSCLVMGCALFR